MKYTYKKQSNGSNSWRKESHEFTEMVFDIEVLNWKLKAVLTGMGLINQVETAIDSMPEPNRSIAFLAWSGAPSVSINSGTTKFVQGVLKLSIEQVTEIFTNAENLSI